MSRTILTPATPDEASTIIADARAKATKVAIEGNGSKAGIGQIVDPGIPALSSSAMRGIVAYDPAELVLVAKAGTPLPEIETALAKGGQRLAFEPADLSGLTGANAAQTIGGIAATNMSGPRRLVAGAARDALLGVRFVNGNGEEIKNGGQVMKNVTGLDLVKLMAGSWGTLGFLTEVSFKVLPVTETERTLVVQGASDAVGAKIMATAMGTSTDVSGAAHLPDGVNVGMVEGPATALRLEGFEASVADRMTRLKAALKAAGLLTPSVHAGEFDGAASQTLWRGIRDVAPFADGTMTPVWKISVAPMAGHALVAAIADKIDAKAFYDWQGGLVWLRLPDDDAQAMLVRQAVAAHGGGHATLVRASGDVRANVPVFQPEAPAIKALSERIRAAMDPAGVFDVGRMTIEAKDKAA